VTFTRAKKSLIILKRTETTKEGKPLSAFVSDLKKMKKGEIIKSERKDKPKQEKVKINLKNYGKQDVIDIQEEYKPNDFKAVYFGDAIHYAFECENIEAVRNLYGDFCNIDEVEEVYKTSKTLIPKGKKEVPFVYNGKVGRIDLLIEREKYEIIDYKSAKPLDESKYIKQVEHYIEAVEAITGKKAKGYLFYTDIKERKKVE
jgi:exodeoxyribonuclease V beta subunit